MAGLSGIFVASLTLFCFKVLFCSEPIFDTLPISGHTTVGSLIHVPSFQKQLWVCINITLRLQLLKLNGFLKKEIKSKRGVF